MNRPRRYAGLPTALCGVACMMLAALRWLLLLTSVACLRTPGRPTGRAASIALQTTRHATPCHGLRHGAVRSQLRMPADLTTIDELIKRTKENLKEGLIVVLHFTDPGAPAYENPYAASSYGAEDPIASSVANVATTYSESLKYGGRPLIVLQIDRDLPGMDVICSQRSIRTFPTTQIFSRGDGETVQVSIHPPFTLSIPPNQLRHASSTPPGRHLWTGARPREQAHQPWCRFQVSTSEARHGLRSSGRGTSSSVDTRRAVCREQRRWAAWAEEGRGGARHRRATASGGARVGEAGCSVTCRGHDGEARRNLWRSEL